MPPKGSKNKIQASAFSSACNPQLSEGRSDSTTDAMKKLETRVAELCRENEVPFD